MPPDQTNLLQGTLDMMILKALALGELHGLGVSRRSEQTTKGTFQVKPGSLFPALHRMQEQGWLVASWGRVGKQEVRQILQPKPMRDGVNWERRPAAGAALCWR